MYLLYCDVKVKGGLHKKNRKVRTLCGLYPTKYSINFDFYHGISGTDKATCKNRRTTGLDFKADDVTRIVCFKFFASRRSSGADDDVLNGGGVF